MDGSNTKEREFVTRVREAQGRLHERVSPTMFIPMAVKVRDADADVDVVVAYEGHQEPGSYLFRGAYLSVLEAPSDATIVCASRGNFGAAVACAAGREGRRAVIFVPAATRPVNMASIGRQRPHEVRRVTGTFGDVEQAAWDYARKHHAHLVSGYDCEAALLGAGTLAAEILAEVPDVTDLLVPTGGGGLLGGTAEYLGDRLRVASVETAETSSMSWALKRNRRIYRPVEGEAATTLGVPKVGIRGFEAARRWQAQPVIVSDNASLAAMRWLWTRHALPADAGAAVAVAALMTNRYGVRADGPTVVVVSGSTVDPNDLKGM